MWTIFIIIISYADRAHEQDRRVQKTEMSLGATSN